MNLKQKFIPLLGIFILLIFISSSGFAKTTNSVQNGNWDSASTWDNGVPNNGDIVVISAGDTVIYSGGNDLKPSEIYVNPNGFLSTSSGKNLEATKIYVYENSKIGNIKEVILKNTGGTIYNAGTIITEKLTLENSNQSVEVTSTGNFEITDEFKASKENASISIAGTFTSKKILLEKENQSLIIESTGIVSVADEIVAKKSGTSISIAGTLNSKKLILEKSDQSLFVESTGSVAVTDEFKADKTGVTITIDGSLVSDKDLKLGKNNHITGSGSVTAAKYDLGKNSTIFGVGAPISNNTVLSGSFVWTGSTSTSWNLGTNWNNAVVPSSNSYAIIPSSVSSGNWPIITDVQNVDSIAIYSDQNGSGSLIVDGGTLNANSVKVERYLPSDDWHIISSPVSGQQMGAFASTNGLDMYAGTYDLAPYSEITGMWDPFNIVASTTTAFTAAKGYIARLPQNGGVGKTVTFTGNQIYSGTQTINIDSTRYGWNSVGNPYTSAIRLNAATNSFLSVNASQLSDIFGGLYFWDNVTDDYLIISGGGSDVITSGQGFVLKCKEGGSKTITFTPAMQVHASSTALKSETIDNPAITVYAKSGDLINTTQINFIGEKSAGLDPGFDVGKLKGNPDIALYTQLADKSSATGFGVQALPDVSFESVSIPLGIDLNGGGNITFSAITSNGFPAGAEVYIEDTELKTLTQLKDVSQIYEVTLPDIQGFGRFNLVVKNYTGKNTATPAKTIFAEKLFTSYIRDKKIVINGPANRETRFKLYSIDGKLWYNNTAQASNQNIIDAGRFAAGVYLLKIEHAKSQQTLKLVLSE